MQYDDTSDTSLGGHAVDSKILYAELLKYGGYRQGAIRKLSASQLTPVWLKNNGTFRPVLIPAPKGGAAETFVKTPAGGITAETLSTSLGPIIPVQTFDSASQEEGPLWTLHQWKLYWNKKTARQSQTNKPQDGASIETAAAPPPPSSTTDPPLEGINPDYIRRLFCLPALAITGTPLESQISPPAAVQKVDLCATLSLSEATPQAQLPIMLGLYPSKSFVNSTMAPGGASVWIYLVSGTATVAVSPPVPKNVATYAAFACGGKTSGIFLPSKCEGSAKAELTAGDTLLLPPGYTYSLAVTSSAVILSGGFLRSDSLAIHLDALRIEEAAKMSPRRQYPQFKQLMWPVASKYSVLLAGKAKDKMTENENFEEKVKSRALEIEKEDRKVAEKAAASKSRAQAAAAAAAAKGVSRPSSAAGMAAGRRGGAGAGSARRRKRPTDDFIESDSDWSAGFKAKGGGGDDDDDDEAEWVPGARQHRGIADSEENSGEEEELDYILDSDGEEFDLEYSDYDDEDGGGGGGYGGWNKKKRKGAQKRNTGSGGGRVTGERQSKRQRGTKLRKSGEAETPTAAAVLHLAGMPPSSLKVKLKLPKLATQVEQQQAKPSPIKLNIKRPAPPPPAAADAAADAAALPPPTATTIPQVDGPGDDPSYYLHGNNDSADHFELSEGEEQGLPVLYITLRRWLRESLTAAVTAATTLQHLNQNPWTVVARLELALKALKFFETTSDDEEYTPPMCTNLTAVSTKTLEPTGAPFQLVLTIYSNDAAVGNLGGGEKDSLDYESGDNAAMIDEIEEEIHFQKRKLGGGGGGGGHQRPSSAMAATSDGKGASNGGGLGGPGGGIDVTGHAPHTAPRTGTPGGTGGKHPLSKTAAAKMKKLSTKDRLKKKLGL